MHLRYILCHEPKLRDGLLTSRLVVKRHGRMARSASLALLHWLNIALETPRRRGRAQLAIAIHIDWPVAAMLAVTVDAGDVGRRLELPEADRVSLAGEAVVADVNVTAAGGQLQSTTVTDGDIRRYRSY